MRRSSVAIALVMLSLLLASCATEQAATKQARTDSQYNLGLAHLSGGDAKQAIVQFSHAIAETPITRRFTMP